MVIRKTRVKDPETDISLLPKDLPRDKEYNTLPKGEGHGGRQGVRGREQTFVVDFEVKEMVIKTDLLLTIEGKARESVGEIPSLRDS